MTAVASGTGHAVNPLELYLMTIEPMPGVAPAPEVDLSTLIQGRLDAKDKDARARIDRAERARMQFRRYAQPLVKGIVDAAKIHEGRVKLSIGIGEDNDGAYGLTIAVQLDGNEALHKSYIIMIDADQPCLVRLSHEKSNMHVYDLASAVPHGSPTGFVRPYLGLLEDLASWIVDGAA